MNLRRIVDNYRSFSRTTLEDWVFADILTAIFRDIVSLEFRNDTAELLERNRIAVYSMFEFFYDASRACELYVLTVDDKLVGCASRYGKGDWTGMVLDHAHLEVVAGDLAKAAIQRDIASLPALDLDEDVVDSKYPMQFIDPDQTMFALLAPRTVYRLNEVPARHRTYFVDDAGRAHAVTSIGDFKHRHRANEKAPTDNLVAVVVEGEERFADATQLLFELIPGQGNLGAALAVYNQPPCWMVREAAPRVNRLILAVTVQHRWNPDTVWVEFETAKAMQAFLGEHPLNHVVPSAFDAAVLGAQGKIYVPPLF